MELSRRTLAAAAVAALVVAVPVVAFGGHGRRGDDRYRWRRDRQGHVRADPARRTDERRGCGTAARGAWHPPARRRRLYAGLQGGNPNTSTRTGCRHGLRHPDGPDHGDLPNLFVAVDGSARAEFLTVLVTVSGGDMPALLDEDGSAVIIHDQPDDHLTQPIGGAGGRIACGIIKKM